MKQVGILVVHGVGEQGRFEHLEAIASNLYKALSRAGKSPHLQVRHSDQDTRRSSEHGWRETPVLLRWERDKDEWIEAHFREVHWADLDMPFNFTNWIRLVGWALGMSGVRIFRRSRVESSALPDMSPPLPLPKCTERWVRLELFGISLLFFFTLISIDLLNFLFTCFSIHVAPLKKIRNLIYDYWGDVKLCQDWFDREEDNVEVVGERSRVAIRRRMVRALVQTTVEVENKELDGYYIFAHSLGTVVAFNVLNIRATGKQENLQTG